MCLGVPGRVVEWLDRDPIFGRAVVEFGGIRRECHMACVPDIEVGDYVVVHAGIAISRINEQEAVRALKDFAVIHELQQIESGEDHSGTPGESHL